jgi:BclA C-terminal domain
MYSLIQLKTLVSFGRDRTRSLPLRRGLLLIPLILLCFGFMPQVQAAPDVVPPPDGSYPGGNTAEGRHALFSRTTGIFNSALGWQSLTLLTDASYNTGVGAGTLALNNANENTATGAGALLLNTGGVANTSNGALALIYNSVGSDNTAAGDRALQNNGHNANGQDGDSNSAVGSHALFSNTTGDCNTALGDSALLNSISGDNNIAIGCSAGSSITTGSNNIYIGNLGFDDESNTIRIGDPTIIQNAYIAGIPAGGLAAILFDFNSGSVTIGTGGAVPFSQAPLIVGAAISKTNNTTFTVNKNGVYRVTYTLRTAAVSLLANVQVHVNGAGVGPTAALVVAGTSLSDQVTFQANAGNTVQLVVGGSALTLGSGDNATINIDKVQ